MDENGVRLDQSFERFTQFEESQHSYSGAVRHLADGGGSLAPTVGQWDVAVHVPREPDTAHTKMERVRKYIPAELRGRYADGVKPNLDGVDFGGTSAPISQVVKQTLKVKHRFVAHGRPEAGTTSAQRTLRKPAMQGIPSASDDPLHMTKTSMVSHKTTSLNEIVKAQARALISTKASDRVDAEEEKKPVPSFFPLEFFDDQTFETHTPEEWMDMNEGDPVEGKSLWHFGDGTSEWKDILVHEYDEDDNSFIIQWVHNEKGKKANRLNICFEGEDLKRHQLRRTMALSNRARIEACMRYDRAIDVMATEDQLQLTPTQFHSIIKRIGLRLTGEQLKRNQALVEDVLQHYSRSINKMTYDAEHPGEDAHILIDPIEQHGAEQLPVQLRKIPGKGVCSVVPLQVVQGDSGETTLEMVGEIPNFHETVRKVEKGLSWAPPHLLQALFSFQAQIAKVGSMSFLWDNSETGEMSVFKAKHEACWKGAIEELTAHMMESMTDALLQAYTTEEAEKGHSMRPDEKDKYLRIVELGNKMLRDAVRDTIIRDIRTYADRMETYQRPVRPSDGEIDILETLDEENEGEEGEEKVLSRVPSHHSEASQPRMSRRGSVTGQDGRRTSVAPSQGSFKSSQSAEVKEGAERAPSVGGSQGEREEVPNMSRRSSSAMELLVQRGMSAATLVSTSDGLYENFFGEEEVLPKDLSFGVRSMSKPVFVIELKYHENGTLSVEPSPEEVEAVSVAVIHELVAASKTIVSFSVEVIGAKCSSPFLAPCEGADFEQVMADSISRVRTSVADNESGPTAVVKELAKFPFLVETQIDSYVEAWRESVHPIKETRAEIKRFVRAAEQVTRRIASDVVLRLYSISCLQTKTLLTEKAEMLKKIMLSNLADETREQSQAMVVSFEGILGKLKESPEDPEMLAQLQDYVKTCDTEIDELSNEISKAREKHDMLEEFEFDISKEDFSLYWQAYGKPREINAVRMAAIPRQEDDRLKFMQKLQELSQDFQKELQSIEADIAAFVTYKDLDQAEEYAGQVMILNQRLVEARETGEVVNNREKLFEFASTSFDEIESMTINFKPYADLWTISAEFTKKFPTWTDGPFTSLDADAIEANVTAWWKFAWKAEKTFEGKKEPQSVAVKLKQMLDDFKPHLPIISALRNPGMRERHWAKLSAEAGEPIVPDVSLTLSWMLEKGIVSHEAFITQLSEQSAKEYGFERTLDKMKSEWKELLFDFAPYKDSGTYMLKGIEDTVVLLDDQIVKVQAMRGSPYAKPLEAVVVEWSNKLVYMQDVLEEWLKCQKTWLYLEPIFASPDIMRQMPTEGRRFQKVDQMWRATMQAGADAPGVLQVMTIEGLKNQFVESNKALDMVQKGLNDYLETKRSAFPRFFFLSNDELLDILSETKDPRRVVPHMPKAFEGICGVKMRGVTDAEQAEGGPMLDILCMISGEGEEVPLTKDAPVEPDAERNRGNVERWLSEMEASMRVSLKQLGRDAISKYKGAVRTEFVQSWTGMIVLATDCLYWTVDVEAAMKAKGTAGVKEIEQRMIAELADIVQLVRGELSKQARLIIGAMVVLDVHNKDVTSLLVEKGVAAATEFDWNSQLRYYQEPGEGAQAGELNILTRMMNASLPYSYEYLGNSMRLVVTPLTDRCYRTLMGALHLSLGGAPEGPAGTGKTETVKDLSKAVAKQCVVFNCSDGLDYLAMAKFFKGLASCGAWACFDEFNRIDLEVLSVVAQQILSLTDGLRRNLPRIIFEGSDIPLVRGFSSFITMNPGYAGRSELPDNLKALFRPCAMMVPDYAMISEICLYSYGFTDARDLARKLVKSLQISSEQLSSQVHYDFGMRAVKSILTAAGQLKRQFLSSKEDILVLRAINDVNLPKFTDADLPLFKGITSDLFLGLEVPSPDYGVLKDGMIKACGELINVPLNAMNLSSSRTHDMNIQPTEQLLSKCMQLYETVTVRHSLMVVGLAMSMKTSVFKVLEYGMNNVADKERFEDVLVFSLNPKSITIDQIYGNFDPQSREWVEGIGASLVRRCVQFDTDPEVKVKRKWILFDGPVDAIWIENMNTVMDDNKKLCLNSGEIIKLTGTMTMMFEPEDLAAASPATVSRNGMVLLEPHMLQWPSLLESWFELLPPPLEAYKPQFLKLFNFFVPVMLRLVKKECKEPVVTKDTELVLSFLKLMNSHLDEFHDEDEAKKVGQADIVKRVDGAFLFCLVWSIGCTTDDVGRAKFNERLREMMSEEGVPKITVPIPDKSTCYDFCWDRSKGKWLGWLETIPTFAIQPGAKFQDILVPTIDTVRYGYVLEVQLRHGYPVLFCGDTGTGKSVMVKEKLMKGMGDGFLSHFMNFSANSKANQTQDIIDSKVDKRRKGVFGPPLGKKLVIFVDDLNMPGKEAYGAQPPIEILRQHLHWGGWWDRKEIEWRQLVDMIYVAAMGLPGGGRTHITCRYTRWYNVILVTPFDDEGMTRIFTTILGWWCTAQLPSVSVTTINAPIVAATLEIFKTVSKELLPSPAKSHYTFNLRDLAKVIQGVMSVDPKVIDGADDVFRVWVHECKRIFQDRLIDNTDQDWFHKMQGECANKHFKKPMDKIMGDGADGNGLLLYGDFILDSKKAEAEYENRKYQPVASMDLATSIIKEFMEDYNQISKSPMELVLFGYVVEHICRLDRVFRQPAGHALLVGVGGSGRQSLTRLAAFISDFAIFSIEITKNYGTEAWFDDLKTVFTKAGSEDKRMVFLFTDSQIVMESQLEDVNNILNTGSVPNLFAADEVMGILDAVSTKARAAGRGLTPTDTFEFFIDQCRKNMHVVLCMSPIGSGLRDRIRQFPSLVNCCTIDWFTPWPRDALLSVASKLLGKIDLGEDGALAKVSNVCMVIHSSVREASERFLVEMRRTNYTTPTSYLELINLYTGMLGEERTINNAKVERYQNGMDKLKSTNVMVGELKVEIIKMQPKLAQAGVDAAELIEVVTKDKEAAAVVQANVEEEAKKVTAITEEASVIKLDAQKDLDEALPAFDSALKALKSLNKNDITEIKSFAKPPPMVMFTLEGVCILKGVKPTWDDAKKLMGESTFLADLETFDKDNIKEKTIKQLKKYIDDPGFTPELVEKVSKAAKSLCMWVRAMDVYARVAKNVEPKKAKLAEAERTVSEMSALLAEKTAQLNQVLARVKELEEKLLNTIKERDDLQLQSDLSTARLGRAEQLTNGLASEQVRWDAELIQLNQDKIDLTGNILMASGVVAYTGAFTSNFRSDLIKIWVAECQANGIPVDAAFSLERIIGDAPTIRGWNIQGLPADPLSTENGIIVTKGRRWPLMIDPQTQANRWIRAKEKANRVQVIKLTESTYLRTLENCIRVGNPVLLENVEESLDPALEPVLSKLVFKQSGRLLIRLGDTDVDYSPDFRFYITSKLPNPHYPPEICVKVTVVNFTVTPKGLEDQLLVQVVAHERPELEEEKNALVIQISEGQKQLKDIEDKILYMLANSTGNILDDEVLIATLGASKTTSKEINAQLTLASETKERIETACEGYRPVSKRGAVLYFVVADFGAVDPMYQYSLQFFVSLFNGCMDRSAKSEVVEERVGIMIKVVTEDVYTNVCRGLFEKDKKMFSFMIAIQIMRLEEKSITDEEWAFFLTKGGFVDELSLPSNPGEDWIKTDQLGGLVNLDKLGMFDGLLPSFQTETGGWKRWFDCLAPQDEALPGDWETQLTLFQKLLVMRVLRDEKVVDGVTKFIMHQIGKHFVDVPPFDLAASFQDSNPLTPIIFVLSTGADPTIYLYNLAKEVGVFERLKMISLGQGQGPIAEALIGSARESGDWVCLQNCHLASSWMPELEKLLESHLSMKLNDDFRLWLSSMPSKVFPASILQAGIKLTNEPPKGLRANMKRTYEDLTEPEFNYFDQLAEHLDDASMHKKVQPWKKLLFGLCFFHAAIQERRKYGPMGWNIRYEWNQSDILTAQANLRMYLEEQHLVPYETLNYVVGDVNYGGRVTDYMDQRCVAAILTMYFCPSAVEDETYTYTEDGKYFAPAAGDLQSVRDYVDQLPLIDSPEIFGLHRNAAIAFENSETKYLMDTIISIQPRTGGSGSGKSSDEVVGELANDLMSKVPALLTDENAAAVTFAKDSEGTLNSLGTFLSIEMAKFNKMLKKIKSTIAELQRAIKGLVVMSAELDKMYQALMFQRVPDLWSNVGYLSLKPLGSWFKDLIQRIEFFDKWITQGPPAAFWMSAFFFPQGYMTAAVQTYARSETIAIDTLDFRTEVMRLNPEDVVEPPKKGVYLYGLYVEGARWDRVSAGLAESNFGETHVYMPVIWMEPVIKDDDFGQEVGMYDAPFYKVSSRAGTLSTTGHSTNFVRILQLPGGGMDKNHWIRRSVALLSQLDD